MAVTVTTTYSGTYESIHAIEMTADGDLLATFAHGLPAAPDDVTITPLLPQAYVGQYTLGNITNTNITINKTNAVGSGAAGNAVRVVAKMTHSIQR